MIQSTAEKIIEREYRKMLETWNDPEKGNPYLEMRGKKDEQF